MCKKEVFSTHMYDRYFYRQACIYRWWAAARMCKKNACGKFFPYSYYIILILLADPHFSPRHTKYEIFYKDV